MHATQARYFWDCRQGNDATYVLIDRVSAGEIATIRYLTSVRKWQWSRRTTLLLHGAAPAEGTTKLLADAKSAVQDGLPNIM
jgi:hypothetical protein